MFVYLNRRKDNEHYAATLFLKNGHIVPVEESTEVCNLVPQLLIKWKDKDRTMG